MKVVYRLQGINFEWDSDKALGNIQKHSINFETACEAFFDPVLQQDEDQVVDGELRECIIAMTKSWLLLYVVYTLRHDTIRLISARPATRQQRVTYENQ